MYFELPSADILGASKKIGEQNKSPNNQECLECQNLCEGREAYLSTCGVSAGVAGNEISGLERQGTTKQITAWNV